MNRCLVPDIEKDGMDLLTLVNGHLVMRSLLVTIPENTSIQKLRPVNKHRPQGKGNKVDISNSVTFLESSLFPVCVRLYERNWH